MGLRYSCDKCGIEKSYMELTEVLISGGSSAPWKWRLYACPDCRIKIYNVIKTCIVGDKSDATE